MLGTVGHRRGVTTHDAGQRFHALRVGDHADFVVQGHGVAIEQLEHFTRPAPAHHELVMDLVQVEDVARLPGLEHHIVGDVHQCGDRALPAARQALDHPGRGLGLGVDVADDPAREPATQVWCFDLDRQHRVVGHSHRRHCRQVQRRAGQCRHLARDAQHRQRMTQIGRELEREQAVVEPEPIADVCAQWRVGRQLQQAAMVVAQLEFSRRAQHAVALDAAQLAHADAESGISAFRWRQAGANHRQRHADARTGIGRAADDLQASGGRTRTRIDPADLQLVGLRMPLGA